MATEKKKLTCPLPEAGQASRYFARVKAFLLYFLISSSCLFCKRNWHPDPGKLLLWDASPHLFGYLALWIKLLLPVSTPSLLIIDLSCSEGTELGKWAFNKIEYTFCCCSVAQSCTTLWPHELQHARLPCPSPSPRACSNSCPLSRIWKKKKKEAIIEMSIKI